MSARVSVEAAVQIAEGDSSIAVVKNLELGIARLAEAVRQRGRLAIWDQLEVFTDSDTVDDRTLSGVGQAVEYRTIRFSVLTIDPKEATA